MTFDAPSITVAISALPPQGDVTNAINWFRLFIDGEQIQDAFTSYKLPDISVTLQTSPGEQI